MRASVVAFVLAAGVLARPAMSLADSTASPPAQGRAPVRTPPSCRTHLYLEPTVLVGGNPEHGVVRLHSAIGVQHDHCAAGVEDLHLHVGAYLQAGHEAIGDAVNYGAETELNMPFENGRIGGRVYAGVANYEMRIVGGGIRYRHGWFHVGAELLYSSRSYSTGNPFGRPPEVIQPAALGALASFGVSGRAGKYGIGVQALAIAAVLLAFSTSGWGD